MAGKAGAVVYTGVVVACMEGGAPLLCTGPWVAAAVGVGVKAEGHRVRRLSVPGGGAAAVPPLGPGGVGKEVRRWDAGEASRPEVAWVRAPAGFRRGLYPVRVGGDRRVL